MRVETQSHIVAPKTYYTVFAILMVLLVLTVLAAQIRHPLINIVVALSIAVSKAVLIVLYFMHLRDSTALTRLVAAAGFTWLVLLIALTFSDFHTRQWDREQYNVSQEVERAVDHSTGVIDVET